MNNSALVGTSGTYFVMAQLAARGFHASTTLGNAPYIDILVSSYDGRHTAAIQVKTARSARRWRGRGPDKKLDHYEWYLGHTVASVPKSVRLFYAFVDLQQPYLDPDYKPSNITPEIFIFPLGSVARWYHNYITNPKGMSRFWRWPRHLKPYKDAYHLLKDAIEH